MKLAGILLSVFLFLFVAALLVLNYSSSTIFQHQIQLSPSPFFLFSLFNSIILAIIVGSHKPCTYEADEVMPFFYFSDEVGEDVHDNITDYSDEDDDDDEYYGSDGYEEDDDDNGSDDEVGWEDEEGHDDNLQKRVEDFIAKVNNGWREERLRDKLFPG